MPAYAQENVLLRDKIAALDKERKTLKAEIEKLRHEKNKTTVKKQVNLLEVGSPMDRPVPEDSVGDMTQLEKDLSHMEAQRRHELDELQQKFEADCDAVKKQNTNFEAEMKALHEKENQLQDELHQLEADKGIRKKELQDLQAQLRVLNQKLNAHKTETGEGQVGCKDNCEHKQMADKLNKRIQELEATNSDMLVGNEVAKQNMEKHLSEWTIRETQMSQAEEDFKVRLQMKWQEMYQKWMETTESRILELQQANLLLRRLLKPESGDGK